MEKEHNAIRKISIHQPEHLPWLGFIHKVMSVDEFVLLDNVQFRKNYFQNRNKIRVSGGEQWITVPLKKFQSQNKINEIEISYDRNWRFHYLNKIKNVYAKAKHFQEYYKDFEEIFTTKFNLLKDFNIALLKFILRKLEIYTILHVSSEILDNVGQGGTDVNLNICKKLNADVYFSGMLGRQYLDISEFEKANIKVEFQNFKHPTYKQMDEPFIPCMSIIDLLFNHGEESLDIINSTNVFKCDGVAS